MISPSGSMAADSSVTESCGSTVPSSSPKETETKNSDAPASGNQLLGRAIRFSYRSLSYRLDAGPVLRLTPLLISFRNRTTQAARSARSLFRPQRPTQ